MIEVTECPVCDGKTFIPHITTTDFSVTQEVFEIKRCADCGFLATSPRPNDADLERYYLSENYISHADQPRSVIDRIYWLARQFAFRTKYRIINTGGPKNILDYGCGTGTFLAFCKTKGLAVTGVEPSTEARRTAAQNIHPGDVLPDLTSLTQQFDVITLWHVLEHVSNLNELISQLKNRLTMHGRLIIAVPNITSWESTKYDAYWAAYDVPRHLWHFRRETITRLFDRHKLTLEQTIPMTLDSFYISLLSEKYKRQNRIVPSGIINAVSNGLTSNFKARTTGAYSSLIYIFHHA